MQSLATRALWSAATSIVNALGRTVASIIVMRQLGPIEAGRYAYLLWLIEFIGVVTAFGLPATMSRFVAVETGAGGGDPKGVAAWIFRRFTICALAGESLLLVVLIISKDSSIFVVALASALFAINGYWSLVSSYLTGMQSFRRLARLGALSAAVLLVGQAVSTHFYGLTGALGAVALANLVVLLLERLSFAELFVETDIQTQQSEILRYAAYTWLSAIVSAIVWSRAELFFLNAYSSPIEVAYFSVGGSFAALVALSSNLLTGSLLPHFSMTVGSGDAAKLQRDYARLTRIVALVVFPISLGGAAVMPELIMLVFGAKYEAASGAAAIMMATGVLAFASVNASIIYAKARTDLIFKLGMIGAPLVIVGCFLVAPEFGSFGVACVRLSVQFLMTSAGLWLVQSVFGIATPYNDLLRIAVAAGVAALAAKTVGLLSPAYPLCISIFAGAVVYFGMVKLSHPMPGDDARRLVEIVDTAPYAFRRIASPVLSWVLSVKASNREQNEVAQ